MGLLSLDRYHFYGFEGNADIANAIKSSSTVSLFTAALSLFRVVIPFLVIGWSHWGGRWLRRKHDARELKYGETSAASMCTSYAVLWVSACVLCPVRVFTLISITTHCVYIRQWWKWSRMHPTETDAVTAAPHATRICQRRIHYTSGPNHTYSQCTHRIHNPDLLARTYTTYHTHTPTSYCAHSYCTLCTYLARNSHTIHISHTHERIALVTYTWDATQAAMAPLLS